MNRLLEEEMLTVIAGDNVVRLLPTLTVSFEEIDLALTKLTSAAQYLAT